MEYNKDFSEKTIHYFWFGNNEKSELILNCIESWKKYFPDFQIHEWNESNYNIDNYHYCRQAYDAKKYAFVSDVARFDILYHYGGLYFDTDVEVLKKFDDLIKKEAFVGFERRDLINPGLVMWVKHSGNKILKEMLDMYKSNSFINDDGTYNLTTVCEYFTCILKKYGLILNNKKQKCAEFTIYPITYFCPYNTSTFLSFYSKNTHSVHKYAASWTCEEYSFLRKLNNTVGLIIYTLFPGFKEWRHKRRQLVK